LTSQAVVRYNARKPFISKISEVDCISKQTRLHAAYVMGNWRVRCGGMTKHYWRWKYSTRYALFTLIVMTVASLVVVTRFGAKADMAFLGILRGCHELGC